MNDMIHLLLSGELPVHFDRHFWGAHHATVLDPDLCGVAGVRMVVGAQRVSVRPLSLHRGDAWPRALGVRRPVHGFTVVHLSCLCELHDGAAAEFAALCAWMGSTAAGYLEI